jgi:RNA polymerase sigma-70 factor (sigma-E family)
VDSQAGHVGLDGSDVDLASAAVGFLSAPPGEPVTNALAGDTAGGADAAGGSAGLDGTAMLSGTNGSTGNGNTGNGSQGNGGGILRADGEPASEVARPTDVTQALVASPLLADAVPASATVAWDASDVVTEIYTGHYNQLVRLAVMLVHDVQTAEEVVQDSFEAMHLAWRRMRDTEKALSYLRQAIVNRSRSVLRHRKVVEMHAPKPAPDEQSAEHAALTLIERSAVTSALRSLPVRQREAVVLRYYGDFSEADIAKAMGISRGAVKSHTARAMAALKSILELET